MAIDEKFFLYSETRNVLYVNDKPHTRFWSHYIRSKYPKDKWHVYDERSSWYINFITDIDKREGTKRIDLYSSKSREGKKLASEIQEKCEEFALSRIGESTFVAVKMYRGEVRTVYIGPNAQIALSSLVKDSGVESIDVWRDSKFIESVTDPHEFTQKYVNKKAG